MTMIMVSYRRVDQDIAGRIADYLVGKYGEKSVFLDVNSIRTGANFVDRITKAIIASNVVVAVIGPQWIGTAKDGKSSRLADPADSVRFEIETALKHNKPILPLLVNGGRSDASGRTEREPLWQAWHSCFGPSDLHSNTP